MNLVGTWSLVKWSARDDAVGRLIYSDDGFMSAFLAGADGFTDALAYSGSWELRGDDVVHHVTLATRESFIGKDLVRSVSWAEDDLVLTTPKSRRDGSVHVLRWRR